MELQQWNYEIIHRKGALHHVPDTVSRSVGAEEVDVNVFETITDKWYLQRLKDVEASPRKFHDRRVEGGMLYRYRQDTLLDRIIFPEEGWRLVVPVEYIGRVLDDAHRETSSGHLGVEKAYDRVAREYYWPGIWHEVHHHYVQEFEDASDTRRPNRGRWN